MPAGTIALTNKSATVAGTGTSFTTELKAGDFVYVNVGGAPYTLVAANITSDTQLTLAVAFDGPSTSGLAWNAVPASLQVAITQKILNDFASVARGRILDFQNWQKIFSDSPSVDVTRPDRTIFTGPSWGYMANQFSGKADKSALDAFAAKGANSDIKSLTGLTTALSVTQGGTGGNSPATANASLGNQTLRIGDATITTSGGKVVRIEGIIGAQQPVGAFNPNQGWYTHYYSFTLPGSFATALTSCTMTVVSARGDQQTAEYPAIVRCTRDKNGGGTSTNQVTVAITTPFTGWYPYFNFSAVGY
ncbi:hypothetical protein [Pantoea sp. EEL5]|uniref:hypothetical protein n=1 Tax=Pantoea sp. EEL5 TaxID=3416806 RepID=UPI003CF3A555